jgi:hypothetical protein
LLQRDGEDRLAWRARTQELSEDDWRSLLRGMTSSLDRVVPVAEEQAELFASLVQAAAGDAAASSADVLTNVATEELGPLPVAGLAADARIAAQTLALTLRLPLNDCRRAMDAGWGRDARPAALGAALRLLFCAGAELATATAAGGATLAAVSVRRRARAAPFWQVCERRTCGCERMGVACGCWAMPPMCMSAE